MNQRGPRTAVTVLVAAGLLLTACGGGDGESEASVPASDTASGDTAAPTPDATAPDTTTSDTTPDAPETEPTCAAFTYDDGYVPIDCSEPHNAELAGLVTVDDAPENPDFEFQVDLVGRCADAVSELADRPLDVFGVDVGPQYDVDAPPGDSNVTCWARVSTPGALAGSLLDVDFTTALGDYSVIAEMEDGTCYLEPDEGFDVGTITDCSTPGALQVTSVVQSAIDDFDPEAIIDEGYTVCEQAVLDATFDLIDGSYTFISPLEEGWRALDRRTIICLVEPDLDATDPAPADAAQPCAGTADDGFPSVPCDEPHGAEFAGLIPPPADVLPLDAVEATTLMATACRSVVEAATGRDVSRPGIGIGYSVPSGFGEPIVSDIPCFISTATDDALVGSIAEIGLDAALVKAIIPDQEPGTCFILGPDNFTFADLADCADPAALMFLGNVQLDEFFPGDVPFPGDDAIREVRTAACAAVLEQSGLAADPATVSGTFPSGADWENLGRRNLACDATPL